MDTMTLGMQDAHLWISNLHHAQKRPNIASASNLLLENTHTRKPVTPAPVIAPSSATSCSPPTTIASAVGLVHVLGYTPGEGEQGVPITANINFAYQVGPAVRVRLIVGCRAIATQVRELNDCIHGRWQLEGVVPPFARQRSTSPKVPLTVQAVNLNNIVLDSVTFGEFIYWEPEHIATEINTRVKRRKEDAQPEHTKPLHALRYSPEPSEPSIHYRPPPQTSDRRRPSSKARGPHNSRLHRRSNLQSTRPKQVDSDVPIDGHGAILQIISPIHSVCSGWDAIERQVGRRLVRFTKAQEAYTLKVTCESIKQEDYRENLSDIVVSCIHNPDEDNHCITSVDIIYLLERLVDDEFEVEEKNRIRRNLEGLKPKTVSKQRPGSEEFFQRIMNFPDPKPRNIEKTVKVFDWNLLPQALHKIISKYSLSYTTPNKATLRTAELHNIEGTPSPTNSGSEGHISNLDRGIASPSKPEDDCGEPSLTYPPDIHFAAIYPNPAVADNQYVAQPSDASFLPDSSNLHNIDSYDAEAREFASAPASSLILAKNSDELTYEGRYNSGNWEIEPEPIKTENYGDLIAYEIPEVQYSNSIDHFMVDDYDSGLRTWDSLEFQTLREHNFASSHSGQSL